MQLSLYYDLQRQMLVSGPQNPAPFILKAPFLAGDTVQATVYAQTPTGTPGTPYQSVPITALLLSLNYVVNGAYVDLANTDSFAFTNGVATGSFTIPQNVTIPATLAYQIASLAAQITTAAGLSPVESGCVLRNPSFPIISPTGPGQYASAADLAAETARAEEAEALLAPLDSPALTGIPAAPTAAAGTNTTQLATTAFVRANGGAVASVNGQTGAVTLNAASVGADPAGSAAAAQAAAIAASDPVGTAQGLVSTLTAGAPGTLDTFLEAYNRFLLDESAESALTATVGAKLAAPTATGLVFVTVNGGVVTAAAATPAQVAAQIAGQAIAPNSVTTGTLNAPPAGMTIGEGSYNPVTFPYGINVANGSAASSFLASGGGFAANGTAYSAPSDIALMRVTAGLWEIDNGTLVSSGGTYGSLNLANLNASGTISAASFTGAGVGTTAGTVAAGNDARFAYFISPESYGAVGDGVTDDTAAFQAALNAMPARGGRLRLRNAIYKIAGNLTCPVYTTISGEGMGINADPGGAGAALGAGFQSGGTTITTTATTGNLLTFAASGALEDLAIVNAAGQPAGVNGAPTAGAGVVFNNGNDARLSRVNIGGFFVNVHFVSGYAWCMTDCGIRQAQSIGVLIEDQAIPDGGDQSIVGSTFANEGFGSAIVIKSGGGLKLANNKFNGWVYHVNLGVLLTTSDLQLTGNNFENAVTCAVVLGANPAAAANVQYENITITGNHFAISPACVLVNSAKIHKVTIGGNTMLTTGGAVSIGAGDNIRVLTNTIQAASAIVVNAGATNVHVDRQSYIREYFTTTNAAVQPVAIYDNSATAGAVGAMIDYGETFPLPAVTSSTPVTVLSFGGPAYSGAHLTLYAEGILQGVGGFSIRIERVFNRDGGTYTATVVGTDVLTGSGGTNVICTASDNGAGVIVVQMHLTAGSGIAGMCRTELVGAVNSYNR